MADENVDWEIYRLQVLADLKRISNNVEKLAESDTEIRVTIGKLQLCAAFLGAAAGTLVSIISVILITLWGGL